MPRLDGVETPRLIAATLPMVRVIGFSLQGNSRVRAMMRAAGATACVVKGQPINELLYEIREVFASQMARRQPHLQEAQWGPKCDHAGLSS